MISEWPAEHSREIHPVLKFLVIAEPYLSATINPNISDFCFDLCLHWVFFSVINGLQFPKHIEIEKGTRGR